MLHSNQIEEIPSRSEGIETVANFTSWMQEVDQILGQIGVDHRDLPDIAYTDLFEGGAEAREAAQEALEGAGAGDEVLDLI